MKTCCHAATNCGCPEVTSFRNSLQDSADLVETIASLALEGRDGERHKATKQLRDTLNRLIDERVEKRLAEKKEPIELTRDMRTMGQRMADDLLVQKASTLWQFNGGGGGWGDFKIELTQNVDARTVRQYIARTIDKAIADRDAEWVQVMRDENYIVTSPEGLRSAVRHIEELAIAGEREACAKVVEDIGHSIVAADVVALIRNRH